MIDFENYYVNAVAEAVRVKYPDAEIVSTFIPRPSAFPHVFIRETDNAADAASFTLDGHEANARLSYTIDIHSNSETDKKRICREILAIVDSVMAKHYFRRIFANPFPNENDAAIYRITARYQKIQSEELEVQA